MLNKISPLLIISFIYAFASASEPLTAEVQQTKKESYFFFLPNRNFPGKPKDKTRFFKITAISETENFIGFKIRLFDKPVNQDNYLCLYITKISQEALDSTLNHSILISAKNKSVDRIPIPWIPLPFSILPNSTTGVLEYIIQNGSHSDLDQGKEATHIQFTQWVDNITEYESEIDWKRNFNPCILPPFEF